MMLLKKDKFSSISIFYFLQIVAQSSSLYGGEKEEWQEERNQTRENTVYFYRSPSARIFLSWKYSWKRTVYARFVTGLPEWGLPSALKWQDKFYDTSLRVLFAK